MLPLFLDVALPPLLAAGLPAPAVLAVLVLVLVLVGVIVVVLVLPLFLETARLPPLLAAGLPAPAELLVLVLVLVLVVVLVDDRCCGVPGILADRQALGLIGGRAIAAGGRCVLVLVGVIVVELFVVLVARWSSVLPPLFDNSELPFA